MTTRNDVDHRSGTLMIHTMLARVFDECGVDLQTWLRTLQCTRKRDDAGTMRIEFDPPDDQKTIALMPYTTMRRRLGGVRVSRIETLDDGSIRGWLTGGNFPMTEEISALGPHVLADGPTEEGIILLYGTSIPQTVASAAVDMPVARLIDHPIFADLTIGSIDVLQPDGTGREAMTRIWLQPSYTEMPMPDFMLESMDETLNEKEDWKP